MAGGGEGTLLCPVLTPVCLCSWCRYDDTPINCYYSGFSHEPDAESTNPTSRVRSPKTPSRLRRHVSWVGCCYFAPYLWYRYDDTPISGYYSGFSHESNAASTNPTSRVRSTKTLSRLCRDFVIAFHGWGVVTLPHTHSCVSVFVVQIQQHPYKLLLFWLFS